MTQIGLLKWVSCNRYWNL